MSSISSASLNPQVSLNTNLNDQNWQQDNEAAIQQEMDVVKASGNTSFLKDLTIDLNLVENAQQIPLGGGQVSWNIDSNEWANIQNDTAVYNKL